MLLIRSLTFVFVELSLQQEFWRHLIQSFRLSHTNPPCTSRNVLPSRSLSASRRCPAKQRKSLALYGSLAPHKSLAPHESLSLSLAPRKSSHPRPHSSLISQVLSMPQMIFLTSHLGPQCPDPLSPLVQVTHSLLSRESSPLSLSLVCSLTLFYFSLLDDTSTPNGQGRRRRRGREVKKRCFRMHSPPETNDKSRDHHCHEDLLSNVLLSKLSH